MTVPRPHVILHNAVSLDGHLDGFEADLGVYYEIAGRFEAQAILAGSNTILTAFAAAVDDTVTAEAKETAEPETGPILVVVDGRGRVRRWDRIRHQPYWRGVVALGCRATPEDALARQSEAGVETIVTGGRRVDLGRGLALLAERFGVSVVRVDSGGRLNAALLRAGLVDEISLLFHPRLAGSGAKLPLIAGRFVDRHPNPLELLSVEKQRGGVMWARYRVVREDATTVGEEDRG